MTGETRPEPMVPAEVDLRGFEFMPLDTTRLLDSDLFALSTGDEFKAAVALWCKSWHQVPAASLPGDERVLAHLSGAGAKWKKVRALAMRGWVLCSDGRYYHELLAGKAIEAWASRIKHDAKREAERKRLQDWRERRRRNALANASETRTETADETRTKLVGEGQGEGERELAALAASARDPADGGSDPPDPPDPEPLPEVSPATRLALAARRQGVECHGGDPRLIGLAEKGVDEQRLIAACAEAARKKPGRAPHLGYVVAILEGWLDEAARLKAVPAAGPRQVVL